MAKKIKVKGDLFICVEFDDEEGTNDYSSIVDSDELGEEIEGFSNVAPEFTVYKLVPVKKVTTIHKQVIEDL